MSTISKLIFKGAKHYVTSSFGPRKVLNTSAGSTSSFHQGTDYGTNGKKIPQYAIEDGYIFAADKASEGALYVWVIYPRIKKAFLHYHLDKISCKAKQTVKKGTILGNTGTTGRSTGVHLHLGIRDLSSLKESVIKSITWEALRKCPYVDPEKVEYSEEAKKTETKKDSFLPSRGYFKKGDISSNVKKIASFMIKTFPAYTDKKAVSKIYNKYLVKSITEFQRRTGLKQDGSVGPKTLEKLETFGFKR